MALPTRRSTSPSSNATTQRWDPFREFEDLQAQMGQLIENVWSGTSIGNGIWAPPVDIEETEDAWVVEAELPGAEQDDIKVEMRDSELVISGEIKERERKGILRRRTRRAGEFEYRVTLPGEIEGERIDASLEHGVLTVRVPKVERARPQRVEVKSGQA
jgi:HSP20 family protein